MRLSLTWCDIKQHAYHMPVPGLRPNDPSQRKAVKPSKPTNDFPPKPELAALG